MKSARVSATAAAVLLVVSACGSGGDPDETVEGYFSAGLDRDAEELCETLSPEYVDELYDGGDCVEAAEAELEDVSDEELEGIFGDAEVSDSTVDDSEAQVWVDQGEDRTQYTLKEHDSGWKIVDSE